MSDIYHDGIIVSHYYSDDGEKEAIVRKDGYGLYFVEYIFNGAVVETQWYPKYTLNTVEDEAEDYVRKNEHNTDSMAT